MCSHERHSNMAHAVIRAQQPGTCAWKRHGKVACAAGKEHGNMVCAGAKT